MFFICDDSCTVPIKVFEYGFAKMPQKGLLIQKIILRMMNIVAYVLAAIYDVSFFCSEIKIILI